MGEVVKRIVLTGGPGAGKSSSIETVKKYLESEGYIVYLITEAATELDSCGIDRTKMSSYDFQNIVLTYQLEREKVFEKITTLNNLEQDIILLYDRGLLDGKVYTKNEEEFNTLLKSKNINEQDILDRYDLILFLEPDVEFVQDGTRNEAIKKEREKYSRRIKEIYNEAGFKYHVISGNYQERFLKAVELVDKMLMPETNIY